MKSKIVNFLKVLIRKRGNELRSKNKNRKEREREGKNW